MGLPRCLRKPNHLLLEPEHPRDLGPPLFVKANNRLAVADWPFAESESRHRGRLEGMRHLPQPFHPVYELSDSELGLRAAPITNHDLAACPRHRIRPLTDRATDPLRSPPLRRCGIGPAERTTVEEIYEWHAFRLKADPGAATPSSAIPSKPPPRQFAWTSSTLLDRAQ